MISKKKKINIGLDIGVASVGWCLLDENTEIIDMGVRLFDDPAGSSKDGTLANAKRRSMRSLRRMIRRRKLRKKDLVSFLIENKFGLESEIYDCIENFDISKHGTNFVHPAQLKVKALKERITKKRINFFAFSLYSPSWLLYYDRERCNWWKKE